MPEYTKELIDYYMSHSLKPNDTFKFTCKMCGSCCRKRTEPILITGNDIYYIAKKLGKTPEEVVLQYTEYYIGKDSKIPVCVLKEKKDGKCVLMKKYKCTVQDMKPVVCAIYPLGRMIIQEADENNNIKIAVDKKKYIYFTQPVSINDCIGIRYGEERTLQSWLDNFNIEKRDQECIGWHMLMGGASQFVRSLKPEEVDEERMNRINFILMCCLYFNYPTNKDYLESVAENRKLMKFAFPGIKFPDENEDDKDGQ